MKFMTLFLLCPYVEKATRLDSIEELAIGPTLRPNTEGVGRRLSRVEVAAKRQRRDPLSDASYRKGQATNARAPS
jgi:hypothetical protein